MNQDIINKLLQGAIDQGKKSEVAITISIVDNGGHLVAMLRQENCSYFAIEASRKKAVTASQFKLPSHVLKQISEQFSDVKNSLDKNNDIELLPGGFPVHLNDGVIGGIGVSGGNFEQDRAIAEYSVNFSNTIASEKEL